VLAALVLTLGVLPAGGVAAAPPPGPGPADLSGLGAGAPIPGRWIVRYADGVDAEAVTARLARRGGPLAGRPVRAVFGAAVRGATVTMSAADAAALAARPEVVSVEPDRVIRLDPVAATARGTKHAAGPGNVGVAGPGPTGTAPASSPLPARFAQTEDLPWGLDRIDTRCTSRDTCTARYDQRYRYTSSGGPVIVYVLDTGIRASHREFRTASGQSRVLTQVSFTQDGINTDCNGHGTHVAGTIGGRTTGVAKNVRFRIVKVLDCAGQGSYEGVIAGLNWVLLRHTPGTRAVVNMSLGGPASSSLDAAVRALIGAGITVVVASGNSGMGACGTSPARVAEALSVNASERWDKDAIFSNGGPCTDLHAPGVGVKSAGLSGDAAYAWKSGTSMAAPHVAGCVARLLVAQPALTPPQVQSIIKARASANVLDFPYGYLAGTPNRLLHCRADW
jgi:subtilisin family serine protease